MTTATTTTDTRFFDGHLWVSDDPDGRMGLSLPGNDPEVVARSYLRSRLTYCNRGRTFTAYVTRNAHDEPIRVDIVA
jgi:hypothetical protein